MDPLEKKRLANERRLKAIQEQKQRNQNNRAAMTVKIDSEMPTKVVKKNQIKLFDSDEEEENNNEDMFKIRPQFEGQNGMQLLEMSSKYSSRFKLDERFKDDEEEVEPIKSTEQEEEVDKNFKILESILGYEVSKKYTEQNTSKKRCIERFDPEDKESSKYIKQIEKSEESKKKPQKKKKKIVVEEKVEEIPISKERYIEVSSNLKDLFQSSSSFSLSSRFQSNDDPEADKIFDDLNNPFSERRPVKGADEKCPKDLGQRKSGDFSKNKDVFESRSVFTFFIREDDASIKEEVDSFVRSKPLEDIREFWMKKKENLMESYRMKKKSYTRRRANKKPTTQGKRTYIKK